MSSSTDRTPPPASPQINKVAVRPLTHSNQPWNLPLLALGVLLLFAALWAGWIRLGWNWPPLQPTLPMSHGPLMVSGFLGTLISLERAVALRQRWAYLSPTLCALGGVALLAGLPPFWGALLFTFGSLGLAAIFAVILHRHLTPYLLVMAVGSVAWVAGNLLWLSGRAIFEIVLWWAGFLILTIAGERLELGRIIRLSPLVENVFKAAIVLFLSGLVLTIFRLAPGTRLAGGGMLALSAWLLQFDIARKTIRRPGLPRFAAICLLLAYIWLGLAGGLALVYGPAPAGPRYDALLHAIFLGCIFSMIFGHAPIIFPAILGLPVKFSPALYLPLALLHLSLVLRVGGDLTLLWPARLWGGLLNGIAVLLFLGLIARSIFQHSPE